MDKCQISRLMGLFLGKFHVIQGLPMNGTTTVLSLEKIPSLSFFLIRGSSNINHFTEHFDFFFNISSML